MEIYHINFYYKIIKQNHSFCFENIKIFNIMSSFLQKLHLSLSFHSIQLLNMSHIRRKKEVRVPNANRASEDQNLQNKRLKSLYGQFRKKIMMIYLF